MSDRPSASPARILCVGASPAAQRVMFFDRLRPGAVNRAREVREGAAGKSINVAKVLHALGAAPVAVTFLAGARGRAIANDLANRGIPLRAVEVPAETRQCVTIVEEGAGRVTELVQETPPVEPGHYEALFGLVEEELARVAAVVLSGTLAPGDGPAFHARCVETARQRGRLSVVDTAGEPLLLALTAKPDVAKPNREELAAALGRDLADEPALLEAMDSCLRRGARAVVITQGPEAVLAMNAEGAWRIRPPAIKALNPIGSGDAFTAAMTLALVEGASLAEACRRGAAAGAANALQPMAGELDPADYRALIAKTEIEAV
ncbi:MAG: 1-phosphofructokinase [Verrucomicrobia bacterium]|nr:MAG: 1-phosphofructokinase [Verrucomicrobiota bacterium]